MLFRKKKWEKQEQLIKQSLKQWQRREQLRAIYKLSGLLRLNTDSKQSQNLPVYLEKLPKETHCFLNDEELQSYLIDYRIRWYSNKDINWILHVIVWLKTWHFLFVEIVLNQSFVQIKSCFRPLYRHRFPRK